MCSKCCPLHTNVLLMNDFIIRDRHPLGIKEEETKNYYFIERTK